MISRKFLKLKLLSSLTILGLVPNLFLAIKFSSQNSTIQLSGSASIILDDTLNIDGTLKILNKSATSIQQTATTNLLTFADGVYQSNTSGKAFISGTIDPATTDKIILDSGQTLQTDNETIIEALEIRGSGNIIKGQPTFSSALVLQNASAAVSIGMQNKLNQNVTMNSGTVTLIDDLALQDGVFLSGNGTVNVGNKTLTLPSAVSSAWTGNLTFQNANDLMLTGYTTLNGNWTFSGGGGVSRVNGNGNILDISGGGAITVGASQTLYLTDMHLKGLGATGGSLTIDATSTVYMSNVTIDLDGSYTLAAGTIIIHGANCSLIARNSNQFIVDGATSTLTVDGVVFLFDPLGTTPTQPNPFIATNSGTISYLNDGVIRANAVDTSGNIEFSIPSSTADNYLPNNYILNNNSKITFTNANIANPKAMNLDGQGYFIEFNYSTSQYMTIQANTTVTFKNIMLKDFDPALINFQGAGPTKAKIIFGDNVTISLNKDLSVSTAAWVFQGNSTIIGNGSSLTLSATNMLTIDNANKVLNIKDLKIFVTHATAMSCLNDASKIVLQDSDIHMTNIGYTFAKGLLDIKNTVKVMGLDPTTTTGIPLFTFSSAGILNVLTNSTLKVERGAKLYYNPDITNDGGDPLVEKYHLLLADPSSALWLDSCYLQTGTMGFALDHGKLFIDGKTFFNINAAVGAEVEFGSALQVEIAPSGILDIDGALKYISTTYP